MKNIQSRASAVETVTVQRRWLAMSLQCMPLLAIASFATRALLGEAAQERWFADIRALVVVSALAWGPGYLLIHRWGRMALTLVVGAGITTLAANESLRAWSVAPDGRGELVLQQASWLWACGGLLVVAVLLYDTWRLTRPVQPATRG